MKSKAFWWAIGVMALVVGSMGAAAQNPRPIKLSGTIGDYTSATQAWEIRGSWSLKMYGDSGTADFTAALNMEHSDLGMINGATSRTQHTHHISLTRAQLISDPDYAAANCPSTHYAPPTTTGVAVVGMASVTGNGAHAPFAPNGELSQVTVCVTGSTQVEFSNITLVFPANNPDGSKNGAAGHFGTAPINGVVTQTNGGAE